MSATRNLANNLRGPKGHLKSTLESITQVLHLKHAETPRDKRHPIVVRADTTALRQQLPHHDPVQDKEVEDITSLKQNPNSTFLVKRE
jgi:hypothetical protein